MASRRKLKRNGCQGKVKHSSAHNAILAVKAYKAKFGEWQTIRHYRCFHCGFYHIGHKHY